MSLAVSIDGIAAGGDGVGRAPDGLAVFVPRTAPGDRVEVQLVQRKARYARGRVERLTTAGRDRVDPRCRHYRVDDCGGCQLQHLTMRAQLEAKRKLVGEAIRRIGRREVADPPIVEAPSAWRYRSRVRLACAGDVVGFRRLNRPDAVFQLQDCLIASEEIMALWRRVAGLRGLLPQELSALVLSRDRRGRLHVIAVGRGPGWDAVGLQRALGDPTLSVWWQPDGGAARVMAGPERGFPATAFEQVNRGLAEEIRASAVDGAGDVSGKVVWDLYAGVGDTADLLAERGAKVWSVERDASAVDWGLRYGSERVERVTGLVQEELARLPQPDVVVLNPPRTGVSRFVARWLDAWAGRTRGGRLVYVSCDPATLARDLALMPSLEIKDLMAYDLFPQTAHVETLARLEAA